MKTPLSKTVPAFAGCFLAALFGVINLVGQDENGGDEPSAPEGEVAGEPDGEGTEPEPEENEPAGPGAGEQPGGPGERPGGPGGRPGGPGGRPGGPGAAVPDTVTLQFPNNPVTDLLGIYERLTSKTIIKDTSIFEGANISLVTPKPVPKDEAIRLIESSLLLMATPLFLSQMEKA